MVAAGGAIVDPPRSSQEADIFKTTKVGILAPCDQAQKELTMLDTKLDAQPRNLKVLLRELT
jgi:hypothetical protein